MYGDHKTYLGKSIDGGATWQRINSEEFTGFAHKIRQDLVNKDLLFLGTEMGLFASIDGGASWFRMKNRIPEYAMVRDIQIEPRTNDLILATHGRGIIVVNDITPMRALTNDVVNTDVHLFTPKSTALTTGRFGAGGFPSNGGWDAGNPSSIQPIQYYLKDRVSTGDVAIDIYDATGKLVQTLPATRRKGINKVYWNLRMTPPKTAQGGTKIDGSGFLAPQVLPGTYTAKLKIGDKEYSTPIVLTHDTSNHAFTLEDRQLQYTTAMELYKLHEELYTVVEKINAEQRMIKNSTVLDAKGKALLKEYNDKLEALRNTLLASKQTSIFADERKLREQISEVYGSVAGQEARPTNLQVQRVSGLRDEVVKAQMSYTELENQYGAKAKAAMEKKGSSNTRSSGG
jgi:hypothetical protein